MLSDIEKTNAVVDAFCTTLGRLTELSPGASMKQGGAGTRAWFTGLPVPTLNSVFVDRTQDLDEIAAFAGELSRTGVPWSIQTRGEAGPALTELAARFGATSRAEVPLMVWDAELLPSLPAAPPPGTAVRRVSGAESGVFASALVRGFGMPREVADALALPALLDAPEASAFVLESAGTSVATGFNVVTGEYVGMFNGSVPPEHRGNGYYRALVGARLRDAVARGARRAFTQNTPMSRPLYASLGFLPAETWTWLMSEA